MTNILLATDGSAEAKRAADVAKEWLRARPDARVTAVYVTQELAYPYGLTVEAEYMAYENKMAEELERELVESVFADERDRVKFVHRFGRPAAVICEMAEEEGFDMIVMGSHGKSAWDRLLAGSVSREVVQRSRVPVLVVKQRPVK